MKEYQLTVISSVDRDGLQVEVWDDDVFLAEVSDENGSELIVRFYPNKTQYSTFRNEELVYTEIDFNALQRALTLAKEALLGK